VLAKQVQDADRTSDITGRHPTVLIDEKGAGILPDTINLIRQMSAPIRCGVLPGFTASCSSSGSAYRHRAAAVNTV